VPRAVETPSALEADQRTRHRRTRQFLPGPTRPSQSRCLPSDNPIQRPHRPPARPSRTLAQHDERRGGARGGAAAADRQQPAAQGPDADVPAAGELRRRSWRPHGGVERWRARPGPAAPTACSGAAPAPPPLDPIRSPSARVSRRRGRSGFATPSMSPATACCCCGPPAASQRRSVSAARQPLPPESRLGRAAPERRPGRP
jgi:hypothetical protein